MSGSKARPPRGGRGSGPGSKRIRPDAEVAALAENLATDACDALDELIAVRGAEGDLMARAAAALGALTLTIAEIEDDEVRQRLLEGMQMATRLLTDA